MSTPEVATTFSKLGSVPEDMASHLNNNASLIGDRLSNAGYTFLSRFAHTEVLVRYQVAHACRPTVKHVFLGRFERRFGTPQRPAARLLRGYLMKAGPEASRRG